jgi:hypothetical protein
MMMTATKTRDGVTIPQAYRCLAKAATVGRNGNAGFQAVAAGGMAWARSEISLVTLMAGAGLLSNHHRDMQALQLISLAL